MSPWVIPHAASAICGVAQSYDGNGNVMSYDTDGAASAPAKAFTYDGENRPVSISAGGTPTTFEYGPDGERYHKVFGAAETYYVSGDMELKYINGSTTPSVTAWITPDVRIWGRFLRFMNSYGLAASVLVSRRVAGH